jgi:hypothetical protein
MSSILIVKGFPIRFNVGVTSDDVPVDINDGTWNSTVELRYQTKTGPKPFDITTVPNGLALEVILDGTQTSLLDHLGTGYVLVIRASKIDQTTFLKSEVQVHVQDDL